ncbi:methyl-accepting chemotaxis protein [Ferrovibrio xuzhouensis]|uniref:Methyl-accepting chemotaxis protein n=1 Tax=Ferrovibrio xuzhouensis TaxID=1576914 RepID=A0ABV7VD02_9PROT
MTLNIGHRIVAGIGIILALMIGIGWYQLTNMEQMRQAASEIVEEDFAALQLIRKVGNTRRDMEAAFESAWAAHFARKAGLTARDPVAFQKEWVLLGDRYKTELAQLAAISEQSMKRAESDRSRQLWNQLLNNARTRAQIHDNTVTAAGSLFDLFSKTDLSSYSGLHDVLQKLRDSAVAEGNKAEELTIQLADIDQQNIVDLHAAIQQTSIIVLVVALLLAVLVSFLLYRSITNPLRDFMRFVEQVGGGDLTRQMERLSGDELGKLGRHLNDMVAGLKEVATQIRGATENLNASAAEMQASVQQQAAGTSEQSAAIQQITSTLNEVSSSGAQISERARGVATAAEAAASASKSGLQAVNETTRAMDAIREQAEKVAGNVVALTEKTQSIGGIITTVNDIAERSSLLALNAAIEAAAAGEHGLSFAVVADEMKNLAGQAKDATVEVRSILGDIQRGIGTAVMQTEEAVKRVESGKEQAAASEQTINELAHSVEQSVVTFEQIVAAMGQQQVGIEQVTQSVHNIREASEQMATGSKEVGRAASTLAALSSQLQKAVERYRV